MKNKLMNINEVVVAQINKYLGLQDISQYELAKRSGVPYATIKSIMQKRTKDIQFKTIILLAKGFEVSLNEFINDKIFDADNLDI